MGEKRTLAGRRINGVGSDAYEKSRPCSPASSRSRYHGRSNSLLEWRGLHGTTATTGLGVSMYEFPGRHGRTVFQWAEGSYLDVSGKYRRSRPPRSNSK